MIPLSNSFYYNYGNKSKVFVEINNFKILFIKHETILTENKKEI